MTEQRKIPDHSACDPGSPRMCDECRMLFLDAVADAVPLVRELRDHVALLEAELDGYRTRKARRAEIRNRPRPAQDYVGTCVGCHPHEVHADGRCHRCDCSTHFRCRTRLGPMTPRARRFLR